MTDSSKEKPAGLIEPMGPNFILPGGVTLGQVAAHDPRLAAALLPPPSPRRDVGVGMHDGFADIDALALFADTCPAFMLKSVPICASFTSTEPKTIPAQFGSLITRDLWVRKITYTVRRPNAFAGSIFKAQSDVNNRLNPNVDFRLTVKSFTDYVIASEPTPLETIELVFECVCPIGFVLGCAATIEADFTLRRALAADEIPYEVCIVIWAITLPRRYDISLEIAIAALAARGIGCCV
jgi:hypothetical protein